MAAKAATQANVHELSLYVAYKLSQQKKSVRPEYLFPRLAWVAASAAMTTYSCQWREASANTEHYSLAGGGAGLK
jgi:hypothetical protein